MPEVNIQGCYQLASLAEHSCMPNAFKTTSSKSLSKLFNLFNLFFFIYVCITFPDRICKLQAAVSY